MTDPIRVDRIPAALGEPAGWTGTLGMTFLPGKRGRGSTALHDRDLERDVSLALLVGELHGLRGVVRVDTCGGLLRRC